MIWPDLALIASSKQSNPWWLSFVSAPSMDGWSVCTCRDSSYGMYMAKGCCAILAETLLSSVCQSLLLDDYTYM